MLLGRNSSSKLSPWLANGSLSIRRLYHSVMDFEKRNGASDSTKAFLKQIFMTDYWKYYCMYHADRVFRPYGLTKKPRMAKEATTKKQPTKGK